MMKSILLTIKMDILLKKILEIQASTRVYIHIKFTQVHTHARTHTHIYIYIYLKPNSYNSDERKIQLIGKCNLTLLPESPGCEVKRKSLVEEDLKLLANVVSYPDPSDLMSRS